MKLLTLVIAVLCCGLAAAQDERVPSNEATQLYPQHENVFPLDTRPAFLVRVAADSKNVVHGAWQAGSFFFETGEVVYANTRYGSRMGDGMSALFNVSDSPGVGSFDPRIAVGPDDTVHIVWRDVQLVPQSVITGPGGTILISHVRHRSLSVAGVWSGVTSVMTGSFSEDTGTGDYNWVFYESPRLAVDAAGGIHIASKKFEQVRSTVEGIATTTTNQSIRHSLNLAGDEQAGGADGTSTQVSGETPPALVVGSIQDFDAGTDGIPHIMWNVFVSGTFTFPARYSRKEGGSWATAVDLTGNTSTAQFLGAGKNGKVHFAYSVGGGSPPRYRTFVAATGLSSEEDIVLLDGSPAIPSEHIVEDTRGNVYMGNLTRVARTAGTVWVSGPGSGGETIDRRDSRHAGLVRTLEPNLGTQDGMTTQGIGPGLRTNVATGNVHLEIPITSTRGGFGFSHALSLHYNSLNTVRGVMGEGWTHSYQITITQPALGTASVVLLQLGNGTYVDPTDWPLYGTVLPNSPEPGETQILTIDGVLWTFRTDGKIREMKDGNGNTMTFNYSTVTAAPFNFQLLSSVVDSAGRDVTFAYDTEHRLVTITDDAGTVFKIEYENGNVSEVILDEGGLNLTWKCEYYTEDDFETGAFEKKDLLARVFTPRGTNQGYSWKLNYYKDWRFQSVKEPQVASIANDGNISAGTSNVQAEWIVTYVDPLPAEYGTNPVRAVVRDPRHTATSQNETTVRYNYATTMATRVTDPLTFFIRREVFNRLVLNFIDKRGAKTVYTYAIGDKVSSITRPTKAVPTDDADPTHFLPPTLFEYTTDEFHRLKKVTDSRGFVTEYVWDTTGNLTSIIYPPTTLPDGGTQNASESFAHDSQGRVTSFTSARGFSTGYAYTHSSGLVTQITRPGASSSEVLDYDVLGNLRFQTPPGGGTTEMQYDALSRLEQVIEPSTAAGQSTTVYARDLDGNITHVVASGRETVHTFDRLGRLTTTESPANDTMQMFYDRVGNTRRIIDFNGGKTEALFDQLSRTIQTVREGDSTTGGGAVSHETVFDYDENGAVSERTDVGSPSRVTGYRYDPRGNLTAVIHPDGVVDHTCFDANDNAVKMQSRAGASVDNVGHIISGGTFLHGTRSCFDERNRAIHFRRFDSDPGTDCPVETPPPPPHGGPPPGAPCEGLTGSGPLTLTWFDASSNREIVQDPEGRRTHFTYDSRDRLDETRDHFLVVLSKNAYNDRDLRTSTSVQNPAGTGLVVVRSFAYNAKGELTGEADAFGNATSFLYNVHGELVERGEPGGKVTRWDHDVMGRVVLERQGFGTAKQVDTVYAYDANSNRILVRVFNPATGLTADYLFAFDRANRVERMQYPGGQIETWRYSAHGELFEHTDANAKVATYGHDLRGRLVTEVHTAAFNRRIERAYDAAGNVIVLLQRSGTTPTSPEEFRKDMAYDPLDRVTAEAWFVEGVFFKQVGWGYDMSSNRVSFTDPQGVVHGYFHDLNDRLVAIGRAGGPNVTLTYDAGGRRDKVYLGVPTPGAVTGAEVVVDFDHDIGERLTDVKTTKASGALRSHSRYTQFDARSNRTQLQMLHLGITIDYSYDVLDRLEGETWSGAFSHVATYAFDKAGNRTSKTVNGVSTSYVYDSNNRLLLETTVGQPPVAYSYDANGNQTSRIQGAVAETFGFDFANRLKSYVRASGSQTQASFLYAFVPTGERLFKQNVKKSEREWYMYDGADVSEDFSQKQSGAIKPERLYVQNLAIDSKLAKLTLKNNGDLKKVFWYAPDGLGSVSRVLKENGNVDEESLTDAWGVPLGAPPSDERYTFAQREREDESGLMHYRARAYDPRTGRFIQNDLVLRNRVRQHYLYASNRPTSRVDPSGLQDEILERYKQEALEAWKRGRIRVTLEGGVPLSSAEIYERMAQRHEQSADVLARERNDHEGAQKHRSLARLLRAKNIDTYKSTLEADARQAQLQLQYMLVAEGIGLVIGADPVVGELLQPVFKGLTAALQAIRRIRLRPPPGGVDIALERALRAAGFSDEAVLKLRQAGYEMTASARITFNSIEDAIGESSARGAQFVRQAVTKDKDLIQEGFTETHYVLDRAGKQWTVFKDPKTGKFTGAHLSSGQTPD